MPVERCITTADAEHFVSGALDDESSSMISAHVAACAECRSRISAVERNLRFADRLVGRLQRRSAASDPQSSRRLPDAGGRYEILRELGRGGSAVVYEAQQHHPPRLVALKVLSVAHSLDQRRARLIEREARVLARLQHPNLAAIHDAGRTDDGRPFLVMELIHGVPLLEHSRRERLSMRRRLELFAKVCDAVTHAHQRGVIHRDLKPSNILVENAGEPKVLDFGLARLLEAEDGAPAISAVSEVGAIAGTLPYMSPEQVRGDRDAIDVRTDVYALGVVLYELLTESLPYPIDRANLPAAAQTICEVAPTRPSATAPSVPGDVETIILKALEKDPDRRYSTASALGDDIRRYLRGEPIAAKPATLGYQLGRLVGRHKPLFITAAGAAVLLLALTVALAVLVVRLDAQHRAALNAQAMETEHRIAAQRQARITGAINTFLNEMLAAANPERKSDAREVRVLDILDAAAANFNGAFADEPEVEAGIRLSLGTTYFALGQYEPAEFQLRAALALRRRPSLAASEDTAQILNKLARVLQETARYDEAEELFLQSLDLHARLFGERSAQAGKLLNNLGWLLFLKREFAEAEPILRDALEVQTAQFGEESSEVATILNNLAAVFMRTGRLDEAEALFRRSLAIDRVLLGDDHLNVAYTTANLAMVLADLGRLEEAEVIQRDALERIRRVLGDDHLSVGVTMHNLATILRRLERPAQAEALLREALDLYSRTVGEDHPRVADTLEHLGQILAQRGEDADAEPLLRRALEIRRARLPAAHESIITLLLDLSEILARTHREQRAVQRLLEALAVLDQADDDRPDLPDLRRRALADLVKLETALGRTDQADAHRAELEALEAAAEP